MCRVLIYWILVLFLFTSKSLLWVEDDDDGGGKNQATLGTSEFEDGVAICTAGADGSCSSMAAVSSQGRVADTARGGARPRRNANPRLKSLLLSMDPKPKRPSRSRWKVADHPLDISGFASHDRTSRGHTGGRVGKKMHVPGWVREVLSVDGLGSKSKRNHPNTLPTETTLQNAPTEEMPKDRKTSAEPPEETQERKPSRNTHADQIIRTKSSRMLARHRMDRPDTLQDDEDYHNGVRRHEEVMEYDLYDYPLTNDAVALSAKEGVLRHGTDPYLVKDRESLVPRPGLGSDTQKARRKDTGSYMYDYDPETLNWKTPDIRRKQKYQQLERRQRETQRRQKDPFPRQQQDARELLGLQEQQERMLRQQQQILQQLDDLLEQHQQQEEEQRPSREQSYKASRTDELDVQRNPLRSAWTALDDHWWHPAPYKAQLLPKDLLKATVIEKMQHSYDAIDRGTNQQYHRELITHNIRNNVNFFPTE